MATYTNVEGERYKSVKMRKALAFGFFKTNIPSFQRERWEEREREVAPLHLAVIKDDGELL